MMIAALVGMATKFAEICLGVMYREKASDGSFVGGPMNYLAEGLHAKWLGNLVAILIVFYSFIYSAVVDTNTMANALQESFRVPPMVSGIGFAVITAIIIFGGISRIGEVCGILSPVMAGTYLFSGLLVILLNIQRVPAAFSQIVVGAFQTQAVLGGAAGATILTAMRYGMARGIFSNEAGIGTAAITHASAKVKRPAEQAVWGPLEVCVDTCIVCMVTGLTIVLSGLWTEGLDGVALTMAAFNQLLPGNWGQYVVLCASVLFGFSCLITCYNYAERSASYLVGPKSKKLVRMIWIVFIVIGAQTTLGIVWDLADTCNSLIIFPNLIGLVALCGKVVKEKEDYYKTEIPAFYSR